MDKRDRILQFRRGVLMDFGIGVLRKKRDELGLTQVAMAIRVGINASNISRTENGEITPKNPILAKHYAECYELDNEKIQEWFRILYAIDWEVEFEDAEKVGDEEDPVIDDKEAIDDIIKPVKAELSNRNFDAASELAGIAIAQLDELRAQKSTFESTYEYDSNIDILKWIQEIPNKIRSYPNYDPLSESSPPARRRPKA